MPAPSDRGAKKTDQRQGKQQPSQRGAGDVGELEDGASPCHRVHKVFFRDQVRNER